ncbi:MAG: nicotinamide-nucleotide amidohydrolase family protein [Peptococcaceae bacterium]|nr:nicotinamide-nucleotide amidohydrolase family protein [Peptococcaceae bacterium]
MTDGSRHEGAERLAAWLTAKKLTLATAESCTGGLLGSLLTGIAGASSYYRGGIIAYSNEAKIRLLGVDAALLAREGAVSLPVAAAMAVGAARALDSDLAIGVTGIAGPAADGSAKPIGLVYIGLTLGGKTTVYPFQFAGDRQAIRAEAATQAFRLAMGLLDTERLTI